MSKTKKYLIYGLIGLQMLAWMVDVWKTWFNTAVEMLEPVFYQEYEVPQVNVPDAVSVEVMIRRTFKQDAKMALAVFKAESGLRCNAVSSTGDIGPAQINAKWHSKRGNLFNCKDNIRVAKEIFDEQGFTPWVAYKSGAYKKLLNK